MSDDETIINSDVRDTPKQNEEPEDSSIPLFLGDIIKITAPTNEIFNAHANQMTDACVGPRGRTHDEYGLAPEN
jgi:hypothetical protein